VHDLVPDTQQETGINQCQQAHLCFSASPSNYEAMIWSGLTDTYFDAWSSLLDFAEEIGFSRHQPLWDTVVEKANRRGTKSPRVDPETAMGKDSTSPNFVQRSSTRLKAAGKSQKGGEKPLHNRVKVSRGGKAGRSEAGKGRGVKAAQRGGVKAGKGRGGSTGLVGGRKKQVVYEDSLETEESEGIEESEESGDQSTREEGEDGEEEPHSGDSEDDGDHKAKESMDTSSDGDLMLIGGDDGESLGEERNGGARTTNDAGDGNAMEIDTVPSGGRSAAGKRRAENQLEPQPSRGKQARTSNKPPLSVNTAEPSQSSSVSIVTLPRNPHVNETVCSFL
jgi:hypothetical protein